MPEHVGPMIVPIETPTLGDRSYLLHDGTHAVVIDPQRDIDRALAALEKSGAQLRGVLETHIHNDYVTGGRALATEAGVPYYLNADDPVAFERVGLRGGDIVRVGDDFALEAVHTPGHTYTHLAYLLHNGGGVVAAFTGGSLLFGSVGRPDLLGAASTNELARAQHASAQLLAARAPDDAQLYPTHGFGSFCSSSQSERSESTIGTEKRDNPALTQDEQTFVRDLLAGLDAFPAYYAHMAPLNLAAPAQPPQLTAPPTAAASEIRRRVARREWVVDLRNRTAFTAGHVPGTLNFGLDGSFVTYLGWTIPWGTSLTLVSDSADDIATAQRELVRIGIDRFEAAVGETVELAQPQTPASFPRVQFGDVEAQRARHDVVVLDVRRSSEWNEAHIDGAVHVPLHELSGRLGDVPAGELWVHCGSGYRASIAASMLAAHGRDVVLIDDDWSNAEAAGVRVTQG